MKYQTPQAFEHHPRLENLFDPAARPVRAGASSPPGPCSQTPVRARVIEHAFEVREAPTPPDMSQSGVAELILEGLRRADEQVRARQEALAAQYRAFAEQFGFPPGLASWAAVAVGDQVANGVRNSPESRAETWTWHIPGYMRPNPALRAVPHTSFGPGGGAAVSVQRPDRWWDVIGWWDELSHPLWRWLHVRYDIHACRCLVLGHRWSGTRVSRLEVCIRKCCRGCERHAQRWSPGPPPVKAPTPTKRRWRFD